jgi:HSP20 family protein
MADTNQEHFLMSTQVAEPRKAAESGAVTKPQPLDTHWPSFARLRQEMDELFDNFVHGFPTFRRSPELHPTWKIETVFGNALPAVDFVDTEKSYSVTVELPGMSEKDVNISLVGRTLTIKGEKSEEKEEKKKDYYVAERRFGSFERSFKLPDDADCDKIDANFEKGVLKVTLPKNPKAAPQSKKIEIKAV